MLYQQRFSKAIRRTALVLFLLAVCSGLAAKATFAMSTDDANQGPAAQPQASPTPAASPRPNVQIAPGRPQQAEQGQHYGEPGFVGEAINLNVVNADIRDILNYITEQYGVNFVIDSSVTAVAVTVNVSDVAWNVALDPGLKANRLGVEVSGNIFRGATTEGLARQASIQRGLND